MKIAMRCGLIIFQRMRISDNGGRMTLIMEVSSLLTSALFPSRGALIGTLPKLIVW